MQQNHPKTVTLVLGGVRSGKSRFALERARGFARVSFIATAAASDDEMAGKIRRHQAERPVNWRTIEEPLDLAQAIDAAGRDSELLLIDCLTNFAANLLDRSADESNALVENFLASLATIPASAVLVSNEVGSGVVPPYPSGRQFRDRLGELNQRVAAVADEVVLLVAGLPLALKSRAEVTA